MERLLKNIFRECIGINTTVEKNLLFYLFLLKKQLFLKKYENFLWVFLRFSGILKEEQKKGGTDMKKKWELPLVLGVILFAFFINITIYLAARLKEPVFLSHYYSVPLEDQLSLEFSYITNRDEEKEILSVSLPELRNVEGTPWGQSKEDYGVYSLYETSIEFFFPEELLNSELIFTEMEILCADGTRTCVDVGEVHLFVPFEDSSALSGIGRGRDYDGSAYTKWRAMEDVEILGFSHYGENRFSDLLRLEDEHGEELAFPVALEEGDLFCLNARFEIPQGDYRRQEVIGIQPSIQVRTANGSNGAVSLGEMVEHEPNLGFRQIYRILKMKGEI